MAYNWTDNAMEVGVANCDPDVINENLMHLKYDNAGGVVKLNPLGSTSSNVTLPANEITTASFTSTPVVTLPTVTDTTKQITSILDFTTASVSYPTLLTTGTLRWSDKNSGKAPTAYSTVSGLRNRLIFSTIDAGANWEAEYTAYGINEIDLVQPVLAQDGALGSTSAVAVYSPTHNGGSAFNILDGNASTYLEPAFSSPVTISFPKPTKLTQIRMYMPSFYDANGVWYASNDNVTYTAIATISGNSSGDLTFGIATANQAFYRYYKFIGTNGNGSYGFYWQEAYLTGKQVNQNYTT